MDYLSFTNIHIALEVVVLVLVIWWIYSLRSDLYNFMSMFRSPPVPPPPPPKNKQSKRKTKEVENEEDEEDDFNPEQLDKELNSELNEEKDKK